MRLTLKNPVVMGGQELKWIDFRRANSGDMLFARGDIAKDNRMNAAMVNDPMTIAAYVARRTATASNITGNLPSGWVFNLTMSDLTDLADIVNAMDAGYESLEVYREEAEKRQKEAEAKREAEERGEFFLAAPTATGADGATSPEGSPNAHGGAGESHEGGSGAGTLSLTNRI